MEARVHSKGLPQYQRILYATDGSPSARAAGGHAVFLAQRAQAQLIVLYVAPNSITRRLSFLLRGVLREESRIAGRAVAEILELAEASGVAAMSTSETGRRNEVIARAAHRFDVDLIVVAAPGGEDLSNILGQNRASAAPLWAARPVCVIMC